MSNKCFIFLMLLLFAAAPDSFAQKEDKKTKAERKEWEKKKKEMEPGAFKEMTDNYEVLNGEAQALQRQIANMSNNISDREVEIQRLKAEIEAMKLSLGANSNEKDATYKKAYDKGLIFKVQVGAFTKIDLSKYGGNNKNFSVESYENGILRYILGYFRNLEEAKNFRNYIRTTGVKDAFIVAYKDNQRLPKEEQDKYNE